MVEDEYTINTKGEADADLLLLIRLILSKEKIKEVLSEYTEPLSLEDCSLEELNSLKTLVLVAIVILYNIYYIIQYCQAFLGQIPRTGDPQ